MLINSNHLVFKLCVCVTLYVACVLHVVCACSHSMIWCAREGQRTALSSGHYLIPSSEASTSHLAIGTLGSQMGPAASALMCIPRTQTQAARLVL